MSINVGSVQTFSDADLLALCRQAYATIFVGGQSYTVANRTFTRADLKELQDQISWLESRVGADGNGLGMGSAVAQFNEPV